MAMTYDAVGQRQSAYQQAINDFRDAHDKEIERVKAELRSVIEKAKAEAADITIPQYKMQCLAQAGGNIQKASEMFAFVMGGEK